jgi:hypothetical protein
VGGVTELSSLGTSPNTVVFAGKDVTCVAITWLVAIIPLLLMFLRVLGGRGGGGVLDLSATSILTSLKLLSHIQIIFVEPYGTVRKNTFKTFC